MLLKSTASDNDGGISILLRQEMIFLTAFGNIPAALAEVVMALRKKWSDLSERTRWLIVLAGAVEAAVKLAMLIDIRRRRADQIRGPKWLWRPLAFVNFFGPVSYFVIGRRRQPTGASGPRKEAARRRFDRWASSYERDRRSRFNARPQREALAALELREGDRLLDVGCGTGAAVRAAAGVAERAVGADISPEMIRRASELASGLSNVEFVVADSEALPFQDAAFTAVLCTASFHHYPDPTRVLAEMARVLDGGGRLVIADGAADRLPARVVDALLRRLDRSHIRLYRTDELAAMLRNAGFSDVAVTTLYDGGYAIVSGRRLSASPGSPIPTALPLPDRPHPGDRRPPR
jgi:SAM-dependent methyltransferase